jgi:hypothetical protein
MGPRRLSASLAHFTIASLVAVGLAMAPSAVASASTSSSVVPNASKVKVRIVDWDKLCMAVPGASRSSNVQVIQWRCNGSAAEYWWLVPITSGPDAGFYKLENYHSGLCLEPYRDSNQRGTPVVQNKCRSTVWQVWDLYYTGSGGDYLIYEVANTGRQACQFVSEGEACGMHPDGNSHSAGEGIYLNYTYGSKTFLWSLP